METFSWLEQQSMLKDVITRLDTPEDMCVFLTDLGLVELLPKFEDAMMDLPTLRSLSEHGYPLSLCFSLRRPRSHHAQSNLKG